MTRRPIVVVALLVLIACAQAADSKKDAAAKLERKMLGTWRGQPCVGRLTLKADGTFERDGVSPAGNRLSGTWEMRWDALPPTLVMHCKESDDGSFVGKTTEVKVIQLDDKKLVYQHPLAKRPSPHKRVAK